ncbi:MAG: hypothetical protein A3E78_08475 [Alphaproteobacteria bacterium RIFCSPHIGHO2_12_FULL_63_12]|nr:MAG: hypothetical protein A3E78_08475 [Alphaproteobacteria bacterium RIFCSPHIGHO2_12_FULL_63_12]
MRLKNYRLSGTQYMIVELDIDGVNKLTSANLVTATTTRFTAPERLWLSDGKVLAVLRGVSGTPLLAAPALPVGAVPVTT